MKKLKLLAFILLVNQLTNAQGLLSTQGTHSQNNGHSQCNKTIQANRVMSTYLMDSAYYYSWDTNSNKWLNGGVGFVGLGPAYIGMVSYDTIPGNGVGKVLYTYDWKKNLIADLYEYLDTNGNWDNFFKDIYTYDVNNYQTSVIQLGWYGSSWDSVNKEVETYNAAGKHTLASVKQWNGSVFVNSMQDIYQYDANNNDTVDINQSGNGASWVNSSKNIYTYNGNNQRLTSLYETWSSSSWHNNQYDTYTYNNGNKMTSDITQTWDAVNHVWTNEYKTSIYYNATNIDTLDVYQQWQASSWVAYARIMHTIDGSGNDLADRVQVRDTSTHTWINNAQYSYTYDANNNQLSELDEYKWNGTQWVNTAKSDSTHYYYSIPSSINNISTSHNDISIYPNPNNGHFTLKAIFSDRDNYTIQVTNLLGQVIYTENLKDYSGIYTKNIDLSMYPKGMYFIGLKTQNNKAIRKVLIN
jgi:hypothetical protein